LHDQVDARDVEDALKFCIHLVEKHW
jgi:hypothetical protein